MNRRYVTAARAAELNKNLVMFTPTGARRYECVTDEWIDWYIVPDDDPRVDTIVDVSADELQSLPSVGDTGGRSDA